MWNPFKRPLIEVEVISKEQYRYSLTDNWGNSDEYLACDLLVRSPSGEMWSRKFKASNVWELYTGTKFKTTLKGWKKL